MPLFHWKSRTRRPFWHDAGRLCHRVSIGRGNGRLNHWFASLWPSDRLTVVDGGRRLITIEEKKGWSWQPRIEIPFDRIEYVDYRFESRFAAASTSGVAEQVEVYSVVVGVRGELDPVTIAPFKGRSTSLRGDASIMTDRHRLFDHDEDHDEQSREYLDTVIELLGVPFGKPSVRAARETEHTHRCTACQRGAHPNHAKCVYCGGSVEPSDPGAGS